MNRGEMLKAFTESGRLSIIPIGSNGEGEGEGEDERERVREGEGERGYVTRFTGAYVCYECGHLCECGEEGE